MFLCNQPPSDHLGPFAQSASNIFEWSIGSSSSSPTPKPLERPFPFARLVISCCGKVRYRPWLRFRVLVLLRLMVRIMRERVWLRWLRLLALWSRLLLHLRLVPIFLYVTRHAHRKRTRKRARYLSQPLSLHCISIAIHRCCHRSRVTISRPIAPPAPLTLLRLACLPARRRTRS